MSTDIIHWKDAGNGNSKKEFQFGALKVYMAISLPIMTVTFGIWYGFHLYDVRKERLREAKWKILRAES